jgi:hypothetical protein
MDKAELRRLSPAERRRLARDLADLDAESQNEESQAADRTPLSGRLQGRRRVAVLILLGCCAILAFWIVVLAFTLPRHFDAHRWRAVWVQFDILLLAAFLATAWALWRERQIVIIFLTIVGTMLCCDAWFDVGTALKTSSEPLSLASAIVAELPLAFLAFAAARRVLKTTVAAALRTPGAPRPEGGSGLLHTPLFGEGLDEVIPERSSR